MACFALWSRKLHNAGYDALSAGAAILILGRFANVRVGALSATAAAAAEMSGYASARLVVSDNPQGRTLFGAHTRRWMVSNVARASESARRSRRGRAARTARKQATRAWSALMCPLSSNGWCTLQVGRDISWLSPGIVLMQDV